MQRAGHFMLRSNMKCAHTVCCDPSGGGVPRGVQKYQKRRYLVLYKLAGFCHAAKIAAKASLSRVARKFRGFRGGSDPQTPDFGRANYCSDPQVDSSAPNFKAIAMKSAEVNRQLGPQPLTQGRSRGALRQKLLLF